MRCVCGGCGGCFNSIFENILRNSETKEIRNKRIRLIIFPKFI